MTVQITIVGLGQVGASIGLALAEKKDLLQRVGHDRELKIAQKAEKMGALDKVAINLPGAVRSADIVLLALPLDQIRETMVIIAPELKEDAVLMDTAPVKEVVAHWAEELLPKGRHYVGLTPVINPAYLQSHDSGIEAAHADLFRDGVMAIVTPPSTTSDAVKLASDLSRLLGAAPLFADPVEVDSLMAATHILPQLMAAALVNATVDQPGWAEGRKLAGRAYAEATGSLIQIGEVGALCSEALHAQENAVRVIDNLVAALQLIRDDIQNQDEEALAKRIDRARDNREHWWIQRQKADWIAAENPSESPTPHVSDVFARMFGFNRKSKPKRKD